MQKLIVETAIQDFKMAEEARKKLDYGITDKGETVDFDKRIKDLRDMWYGRRIPKTVPWKFCSNRSMKIGTAILEMMHSRMMGVVWNEDFIRWKAGEKNDIPKVERLTLFMKWWVMVRTKMRNFFDGWVKTVTGMGDVTTEGAWDIKFIDSGKVNETPIVDELGAQVFEKDGTPSTNREKILDITEKTKMEILPKENVYLQEGQKSLQDEPVIIKMKLFYVDLEQMEAEGKATNIQSLLRPEVLRGLENQFQGEQDKEREIMMEVKLRNTPIEVLKQYMKIDIDRDGFPEDVRVLIDPDRRIYLGGVLVRDLTESGRRPLDCTKYNDYIDRVGELDGIGILEIVKPLSDEIDAIFNQMTDSHTLSVLRPGFYDPTGNLRPQTFVIAPNKMFPVPDPSRNVFFPDFQIATEKLIISIRLVLEFIERLTGASSYIMGKESEIVGGSGTATRTQAIIANAEQRFSLPATRLKEGASRVLNIVLDLVQKNLPLGLESRVLGEDDEPVFNENELTREGISGEFDAYILSDPSMGSKQLERDLASSFYQILLGNPIVATDPVKIYRTTANLIKSFDKEPELFLGPEPDELDFDSPEDENTLIIQGDFSKVRAMFTENHIEHIAKHQVIQNSPVVLNMQNAEMAQQIIAFAQQHIQEHMMMLSNMLAMTGRGGLNVGGEQSQGTPAQGASPVAGLEGISGPTREVDKRQKTGRSSFSPAGGIQ